KLVELLVRDDGGTALDQDLEQFIHLRLERHDGTGARQLTCVQVQGAFAENEFHGRELPCYRRNKGYRTLPYAATGRSLGPTQRFTTSSELPKDLAPARRYCV